MQRDRVALDPTCQWSFNASYQKSVGGRRDSVHNSRIGSGNIKAC